jgi:predicted metal-dependent hydrolase
MKVKIIKKNVKNITIKITKECEVVVSAPYFISDAYVQKFIALKQKWIDKKLACLSLLEKPKKYINKEKFLFLGENYFLKIIKDTKENAYIEGDTLFLHTTKDDFLTKEKIIKQWYQKEAYKIYEEIIKRYKDIIGKDITKLRVKSMKTRWGSCNYKKGYINLSLELIKKPLFAIEYVVFHELTHLLYPNHSKEFYGFIQKYMPDYKKRKELLK